MKCSKKNLSLIRKEGKDFMTVSSVKVGRNYKKMLFLVNKDGNYSEDELFVIFFEKLEKGEFQTKQGGVLKQNADESYSIDNSCSFPRGLSVMKKGTNAQNVNVRISTEDGTKSLIFRRSLFGTMTDSEICNEIKKRTQDLTFVSKTGKHIIHDKNFKWKIVDSTELTPEVKTETVKEEKKEDKKMIAVDNEIIVNPVDKKAESLKGKKVLGSRSYNFKEKYVGTLERIDPSSSDPFVIKDTSGDGVNLVAVPFIQKAPEPVLISYDFEDSKVRDSLRGKWFKSKNGTKEEMVYAFKLTDDGWRMNGLSARNLMDNYTWLDGSPCYIIKNLY